MATTPSKKPVKTSTRASNTQATGPAAKVVEEKGAASKKAEPKKNAGKDTAGKNTVSKRGASASRSAPAEKGAGAAITEKVSSTLASPEKKTGAAVTVKSPRSVEAQSTQAQEDEKSMKQAGQSKQVKKKNKAAEDAVSGKTKVLRDSYSIPEAEHKEIAALKKRCAQHGRQVKKSYLLRAGLQTLVQMDDDELLATVERVR